ncbi:MAG: hypothetical protein NTW28_34265 [Candidatus Solibacter sp.]|nr:hypothetical protein [Candidatus Solibacter sp.]
MLGRGGQSNSDSGFLFVERRLEGAYRAFWLSPANFQFYQLERERVTLWHEAPPASRGPGLLWNSASGLIAGAKPARRAGPDTRLPQPLAEQDSVRIHGAVADKPISIDCPDRSHCPAEINSLVDRLEAAAVTAPVPEHPPLHAIRAIDLTWDQDGKSRPAARDSSPESRPPTVRQAVSEPGRLVGLQARTPAGAVFCGMR